MTPRYALWAILLALLAGCSAGAPYYPDAPTQDIARPIAFDGALWQAARETVDFLPLAKTDPVAGTIETDWGSPRGVFTERYKITVGLAYGWVYTKAAHVTVQYQTATVEGWTDAPADPKIAEGLARDIAKTAQYYAQLRSRQIAGN